MRALERFRAFMAGLPTDPDGSERMWRDAEGQPVGRIYRTHLGSAFQPMVSATDGSSVAWDALIRTHGGNESALHPWNVFALAASEHELIELDRLCRILHTLGFFSRIDSGEALHVKVHERLLRGVDSHHGETFRRILDRLGVRRSDVVIELPHSIVGNHRLLGAVTTNYRLNGFPVALNFARHDTATLGIALGECSIDILKPWAPAPDTPADDALPDLLAFAHRRRIATVVTRIESMAQLRRAREAGANQLQGYAIAPPSSKPLRAPQGLIGEAQAAVHCA
jgi:EAL domain-containing protein (putative c-di-GMP-specific phosphodiesterase class I)